MSFLRKALPAKAGTGIQIIVRQASRLSIISTNFYKKKDFPKVRRILTTELYEIFFLIISNGK